ncbi:MAG: sialate O-acetylesterase [Bacteriovoracaceae bacterium]|nr:sialate O-acetylesterase [Bacteriovoracaceae bacterium]
MGEDISRLRIFAIRVSMVVLGILPTQTIMAQTNLLLSIDQIHTTVVNSNANVTVIAPTTFTVKGSCHFNFSTQVSLYGTGTSGQQTTTCQSSNSFQITFQNISLGYKYIKAVQSKSGASDLTSASILIKVEDQPTTLPSFTPSATSTSGSGNHCSPPLPSSKPSTQIWVIHGQSNAQGEQAPGGSTPGQSILNTNVAMEFRSTGGPEGSLIAYNETLSDCGIGEWEPIAGLGVVHAKSKCHNLMWNFSLRYHELTGHKVVVVPAFRGATAVTGKGAQVFGMNEYWMNYSGFQGYNAMVQKINKAKLKLPGASVNFLFYLGEYDAFALQNGSMSKEEFKNLLKNYINKIIADTGAETIYSSIMHYLSANLSFKDGVDKLAEAQNELSLEMPTKFKIVYDSRPLMDPLYHHPNDFIHLSPAGLDMVGKKSAEGVAQSMNCDSGPNPLPTATPTPSSSSETFGPTPGIDELKITHIATTKVNMGVGDGGRPITVSSNFLIQGNCRPTQNSNVFIYGTGTSQQTLCLSNHTFKIALNEISTGVKEIFATQYANPNIVSNKIWINVSSEINTPPTYTPTPTPTVTPPTTEPGVGSLINLSQSIMLNYNGWGNAPQLIDEQDLIGQVDPRSNPDVGGLFQTMWQDNYRYGAKWSHAFSFGQLDLRGKYELSDVCIYSSNAGKIKFFAVEHATSSISSETFLGELTNLNLDRWKCTKLNNSVQVRYLRIKPENFGWNDQFELRAIQGKEMALFGIQKTSLESLPTANPRTFAKRPYMDHFIGVNQHRWPWINGDKPGDRIYNQNNFGAEPFGSLRLYVPLAWISDESNQAFNPQKQTDMDHLFEYLRTTPSKTTGLFLDAHPIFIGPTKLMSRFPAFDQWQKKYYELKAIDHSQNGGSQFGFHPRAWESFARFVEIATDHWKDDIQMIENDNERDLNWFGLDNTNDQGLPKDPTQPSMYDYYTLPLEHAASLSAIYDGHEGTLASIDRGVSQMIGREGKPIKLSMTGTWNPDSQYPMMMRYWFKENRSDSKIAFDILNYHRYGLKGAYPRTPGQCFWDPNTPMQLPLSPEEDKLYLEMKKLSENRERFFPDLDIMLSEFGNDTRSIREGSTSDTNDWYCYNPTLARILPGSTASNIKDREQVQAEWAIRAYMAGAAANFDRMHYYTLSDMDANNFYWYLASGVTAHEGTAAKISYYYINTLMNVLKGTKFDSIVSNIDFSKVGYQSAEMSNYKTPAIYRFKGNRSAQEKKTVYSIWSPTTNGKNFQYNYSLSGLPIGATAKIIKLKDGYLNGMESVQTIGANGILNLLVTESPTFVVLPNVYE